MFNKDHFKLWFEGNYFFNTNGKIGVKNKVSQYKTPDDVAQAYWKACSSMFMPTDWQIKECSDYIEELRPKKEEKKRKDITNAETWVTLILNSNYCPFRMSRTGTMFEYAPDKNSTISSNADINDVLSWLRLQNSEQEGYKDGQVKDALTMCLRRANYNVLYKIFNGISYKKEHEKTLDTFLKFNYDYWKIKCDYDVYATIFKQWMWCLKRKMCGLDVRHHIWINLYGTTGFGKTEWFKKFTSFLEDFRVMDGGLQLFEDMTREYKKFANNYILFFDELAVNSKNGPSDAGLSDNAIASLKQTVTGDIITPRILGGQEQAKVKNRAMCFSAANWHLYDIIFDETSMRRFFEFEVGRTDMPTSNDYEKLNAVLAHSKEAFAGINENDANGYFEPESEIGKKIREIQKNFRPTRTTVHAWIRHNNVHKGTSKTAVPASKLYSTYKEWCKANNYNARNIDGFLNIINNYFECNENEEVKIELEKDTKTGYDSTNDDWFNKIKDRTVSEDYT